MGRRGNGISVLALDPLFVSCREGRGDLRSRLVDIGRTVVARVLDARFNREFAVLVHTKVG